MNTTFEINGINYRIKKMNAIELLAIRGTISFDDYEKLAKAYDVLLSKVEVQLKDKWLQVKQGDDFYPASLENDPITVEKISRQVMSYIVSVFQQSDTSK